jgi:transposase
MKAYQKEDVIKEIENELTIKSVCKKLGLSRQTVYRWLKEDKKFGKDLHNARQQAIADMNDECENRVLNKIRNDDAQMIKFWLRYHHEDYKQSYIVVKGK